MTADRTARPLDLAKIRANLDAARIHLEEAHFDCCSGHRLGWFVPALLAEVERLRAVADAAIAWRRMRADTPTKPKPESAALIAAVDALDTAGTAPAAGGEAGR